MSTWPTVELQAVAGREPNSMVDGPFGSDLRTSEYLESGVPLIRIQNVKPNEFSPQQTRFISERKAKELARHKYRPGDVVITKLGDPCGVACIVPEEAGSGVIVADIVRFRGDEAKIDHRFLVHFINSPNAVALIHREAKGTTRQRVNLSNFKKLHIPLPPLAEQRRIADALEKAHSLGAKRRAALTQLDTLTQAIFLDMFGYPATNPKGWQVSLIGEAADVQGGLQVSGARTSYPREVPYLRVANVYRGYLDLSEVKTLRATDSEIARTALLKGDLLVVEGHGNPDEIGRVALWDGSVVGCVHQNHIIRVRVDGQKLVPIYACEYLNSPGGRRHLLRAGKTTSGLNTISVSEVRAAPIAVPPVSLQLDFARRVAAVERLKVAQRASLDETDALFAALQHRAFQGEL